MTDDLDKYYRKPWMSDDQWECALMVSDLRGGFHHIDGGFKPCGVGLEVNTRYGCWSTYDYSDLTRAVVLSHDRMIRFQIAPSGPGMLKLRLWKRHVREGRMHERHPTLEDAITTIRGPSA